MKLYWQKINNIISSIITIQNTRSNRQPTSCTCPSRHSSCCRCTMSAACSSRTFLPFITSSFSWACSCCNFCVWTCTCPLTFCNSICLFCSTSSRARILCWSWDFSDVCSARTSRSLAWAPVRASCSSERRRSFSASCFFSFWTGSDFPWAMQCKKVN